MTSVSSHGNRNRGAQDERDVDKLLGGNGRWEANSGGKEDVRHDLFAIQVKGGLSVTSATMRGALEDARTAAATNSRIPLVALVDRKGTRIQRWVCFPMEEFVADVLPLLTRGEEPLVAAVAPPYPHELTLDGIQYTLIAGEDKGAMDDPRRWQGRGLTTE
jgi:hypothetical protein